jgi:hypothetical protein
VKSELERMLRIVDMKGPVYPFTPEGIRKAAEDQGVVVDEATAEETLEKARSRMIEVFNGLWETFQVPPQTEVEECLRNGNMVRVRFRPKGGGTGEAHVATMDEEAMKVDLLSLPFPPEREAPGEFVMKAWRGYVALMALSGLAATKDGVFFRTEREKDLEEALRDARALRPLFSAMGLPDLEEELKALKELPEGEARMEGPYFLNREGRFMTLRRGSLFGDNVLDKAFYAGQEVKGSFPGGVEITLKGWTDVLWLEFSKVQIRLEGEEARFSGTETPFFWDIFANNAVARAIQRGLKYELESPRSQELSPKMKEFIRAFLEHDDPFSALKEGRLLPRTDISPSL